LTAASGPRRRAGLAAVAGPPEEHATPVLIQPPLPDHTLQAVRRCSCPLGAWTSRQRPIQSDRVRACRWRPGVGQVSVWCGLGRRDADAGTLVNRLARRFDDAARKAHGPSHCLARPASRRLAAHGLPGGYRAGPAPSIATALGMNGPIIQTSPWSPPADHPFQPVRRLQGGLVSTRWADHLHAQGQTPGVEQARDVDAGCSHERPQTVED